MDRVTGTQKDDGRLGNHRICLPHRSSTFFSFLFFVVPNDPQSTSSVFPSVFYFCLSLLFVIFGGVKEQDTSDVHKKRQETRMQYSYNTQHKHLADTHTHTHPACSHSARGRNGTTYYRCLDKKNTQTARTQKWSKHYRNDSADQQAEAAAADRTANAAKQEKKIRSKESEFSFESTAETPFVGSTGQPTHKRCATKCVARRLP